MKPQDAVDLIEDAGGKIDGITLLPDKHCFATASFDLPKDHWIYNKEHGPPPMALRMGNGRDRQLMAELIRQAGKYAYLATGISGDEDHDPDAFLKNLVIALLGYWTEDGTSGESSEDPDPLPPLFKGMKSG